MLSKIISWLSVPQAFAPAAQEPAPCPSDIIAGIVTQRIIASPESVKFGFDDGRWEDEASGISLRIWKCNPTAFYFTHLKHRGKDLSPTKIGQEQLCSAVRFCYEQSLAAAEAKRKYEGDMAACDAIADMFGNTEGKQQ